MQLGLWDCLRPSHLLLGQGLTRPGQPWREWTQVRVCILIDSDVSTVTPPPGLHLRPPGGVSTCPV